MLLSILKYGSNYLKINAIIDIVNDALDIILPNVIIWVPDPYAISSLLSEKKA